MTPHRDNATTVEMRITMHPRIFTAGLAIIFFLIAMFLGLRNAKSDVFDLFFDERPYQRNSGIIFYQPSPTEPMQSLIYFRNQNTISIYNTSNGISNRNSKESFSFLSRYGY